MCTPAFLSNEQLGGSEDREWASPGSFNSTPSVVYGPRRPKHSGKHYPVPSSQFRGQSTTTHPNLPPTIPRRGLRSDSSRTRVHSGALPGEQLGGSEDREWASPGSFNSTPSVAHGPASQKLLVNTAVTYQPVGYHRGETAKLNIWRQSKWDRSACKR